MTPLQLRILCGIALSFIFLTSTDGKLKSWGNWNRAYPKENISLETYFDIIAEKINNETQESGSGLTLSSADYDVNRTLFGQTIKGKVHITNPVITEFGNISRCFVAIFHNRTDDHSSAFDRTCIRVSNMSLFYDLKAELTTGDVGGTVEVQLGPWVDFTFDFVHTYENDKNEVTPTEIIFTEQVHNFQPRTVKIYAIEKAIDTETGLDVWYGKDLINWQTKILSPLIEKMSEGLKYPANQF